MKPYHILLLLALFFAMTASAQKPLTKPEKPTQTSPAVKPSSGTTSKSSNKTTATNSTTRPSTSTRTPEERIRELYTNLKKDNYDVRDYSDFKEKLANDKMRRSLYENMKADDYDLPEYDKFSEYLGF